MASIFSSPKIPKAPEPIKTPTRDDAIQMVEAENKLQARKGRASTILTGQKTLTQMAGANGGGTLKTKLGQ